MSYKIIIFIVGISLLIVSFSSNKKSPIKLISASSENWLSGTNGGGKGTEYYIKIKILSSNKVEFDSLFTNKKGFKTYLANPNKGITSTPITVSKNDTITVRVSDITFPNRPIVSQNNVSIKKFKGEALLKYYDDGKINYLLIKNISKTKSINRP
jgi:hypothetical protein